MELFDINPNIIAAGVMASGYAVFKLKQRFGMDRPDKLSDELVNLSDADVKFPGHMAFANKGGEYFHGSRVARFANTSDLNRFFEPGAKGHLCLVGELIPMADGSILCVYTAKLSEEDKENLEEFNRNMHEHFSQRKQERQREREEEQKKAILDAKETQRLAGVGRDYEARLGRIKELPANEQKEAKRKLNAGDTE